MGLGRELAWAELGSGTRREDKSERKFKKAQIHW